MKQAERMTLQIVGTSGILPIYKDDIVAWKLAMLLEGECFGLGPTHAAKKYGYSKQRYFQTRQEYYEGGSQALATKKTGPKTNRVRTENVVTEILRQRFLYPDASAEVIAQRMRQIGISVSVRSVERTITERGLQKKTPRLSVPGDAADH